MKRFTHELHKGMLWVAAERVREVAQAVRYQINPAIDAWNRDTGGMWPILWLSPDVACLLFGADATTEHINFKYWFEGRALTVRISEEIERWELKSEYQ